MHSDYSEKTKLFIRRDRKRLNDTGDAKIIANAAMEWHFVEIYQDIEWCRFLVHRSWYDLVRAFLKGFDDDENQPDLIDLESIEAEAERNLLARINVRRVLVPSRGEFVDIYDCADCTPDELDEAAEYLDKQAAACRERAEYLRLLATYRRTNQ